MIAHVLCAHGSRADRPVHGADGIGVTLSKAPMYHTPLRRTGRTVWCSRRCHSEAGLRKITQGLVSILGEVTRPHGGRSSASGRSLVSTTPAPSAGRARSRGCPEQVPTQGESAEGSGERTAAESPHGELASSRAASVVERDRSKSRGSTLTIARPRTTVWFMRRLRLAEPKRPSEHLLDSEDSWITIAGPRRSHRQAHTGERHNDARVRLLSDPTRETGPRGVA